MIERSIYFRIPTGQKTAVFKYQPNDIVGKWNADLSLTNIESGRKTAGGRKTDFLRCCFSLTGGIKIIMHIFFQFQSDMI